MTDTVHSSNRWVSKDIDFSVFNNNILHINPKGMHIWNVADKDNGTNTLYNNLVIAIQEAQVKDIDSTWKYVVIDASIESMSFFQSPTKPNCPSSILTELTDEFSNDGYKFVWLTGNVHAERNHKLWCQLNNVYVDESWVLQRDQLAVMQLSQPSAEHVQRHTKPKYIATCMNRFHKKHRLQMLQSLWDKNAFDLNKIKVTFPNRMNEPGAFKSLDEDLQALLPIPLAEGTDNEGEHGFIQWDWHSYKDDYQHFLECFRSSYIDIVSETFDGDYNKSNYNQNIVNYPFKQNFVTEKTWRCFHWRRPFLLNAEPDSIKHLHRLGFKTFGDFWDESYASLPTMEARTEAIADIVADMLTWSESKLNSVFDSHTMQDILDHNAELFREHAGKNTCEKMLTKLYTHKNEETEYELEPNTKYQSPNFDTEVYEGHLIIAPQTPLEFKNNDALEELFDVVTMLGKGKTIVFDHSREAIDKFVGNITTPFHLMQLLCDRFDLEELIYIDGNAMVQHNYDTWCELHNIKPFMKCYSLHIFAKLHYDFQPQLTADYSTPMRLSASCCNMIPKQHRADMIKTLFKAGWLGNDTLWWTWHENYNNTIGEQWFQDVLPILEILPNSGPDGLLHANNNAKYQWNPRRHKDLHKFLEIFEDTYFDIISESHSFYDTLDGFEVQFPTEKTWRSINYGRAFVINGPKYSIKHLQDLGFETFSNYWSEDYDQWGGLQRCEAIRDSIKPYVNGQISCYDTFSSKAFRDIITHNTHRFKQYQAQQTPKYLIDNVIYS